jgi:hypothetical protein
MKGPLKFVFLVCILCACSGQASVPSDVLPPKDMQSVLWDVMLADEVAEFYLEKNSTLIPLTEHTSLYQKVFQLHKISKEKFDKSVSFYEHRPDLLQPILDSLQKKSDRNAEATQLSIE